VATDIAARGIDIDELTHVINYELPNVPETYVHRIGRTGRAGASGIALSFCDQEEKEYLRDIHKLIGNTIPVESDHPYVMETGSFVFTASQNTGVRELAKRSIQKPFVKSNFQQSRRENSNNSFRESNTPRRISIQKNLAERV
jgi:ATP-dependent RNA helicase RhlE